jgi:hypothetical protein
LNSLGIDARRMLTGQLALSRSVSSIKVHVFDIEGVDVTGDVAKEGEADVDKKVRAAACDHKDAHRGNWRKDYQSYVSTDSGLAARSLSSLGMMGVGGV